MTSRRGCLGTSRSHGDAATMTDASVVRIERQVMIGCCTSGPSFRALTAHWLDRNVRSRKTCGSALQLEREALLGLSCCWRASARRDRRAGDPKISQKSGGDGGPLARDQRVHEQFRKLGFIEYNGGLPILARSSTSFCTVKSPSRCRRLSRARSAPRHDCGAFPSGPVPVQLGTDSSGEKPY